MANQRPDPELRLQTVLPIPLVRPEKTTPPPSPLIPARAVVAQTARGARGGASCAFFTRLGRAPFLGAGSPSRSVRRAVRNSPVATCLPASEHCDSELACAPKSLRLSSAQPPPFSGSAPRRVPGSRGVFTRRRWPSAQRRPEPGARTGAPPAHAMHTPCTSPRCTHVRARAAA